MQEPDNDSLQIGREFGNRAQCNPTYFTVGNLVKHLMYLRDVKGLSTESILKDYAFVTAGGCGPCRMGMYATEYRKALRDSGFAGFRVLLFTRSGDVEDVLMDGLNLDSKDVYRFFIFTMVGDILNTINIRRRPYEVNAGDADRICIEARGVINEAIESGKWLKGLWQARKILNTIKMDKTRKRPKVHIMGEFWAKTTDSEGNYNLFRFIEKEGGEVSNETVTDWLLHQVWRARWQMSRNRKSKLISSGEIKLKIAEVIIQGLFNTIAFIMGEKVRLSNHASLAKLAHEYFDLHVDGGEDHMEVAHHIHIAQHRLADLIISVKPFTCLSSSGVSDGVQSKISDLYPQVEFIAVETNGDSAANFYSRIQMAMQKVLTPRISSAH